MTMPIADGRLGNAGRAPLQASTPVAGEVDPDSVVSVLRRKWAVITGVRMPRLSSRMSGQEMQRNCGSHIKTSGWHAGHRCPARSNPGSFSTIQRARRGAVWRLVPGKWLFGVTDGRTPGFHRDWWSPPYPASQGNRVSSTAMARAVVSWGATRTGMATGAVVGWARRARWLRPQAFPPCAPGRRSCEGVL